jgi:RNA polymerase subunit RPABC4/transcription elongation factor Spt4
MGYSKNPFNSPEGQKVVKDIFDLMFIEPQDKPSEIEKTDKIRQVSHYRGNIISIVNKMKRFVTGYQQVPRNETASSGIHVCPHCARRDAIWNWEVVDAGHYASPNNWVSSVALTEWDFGNPNQRGRWCFVLRYRCNTVTTCQKCHITVTGRVSRCPNCDNTEKSKASPDRIITVGCGEESYATHFVREYTADNNHPWGEAGIEMVSNIVDGNRQIRDRRDVYVGDIKSYEFKHTLPPEGQAITEWYDIMQYLPHIEITYFHEDLEKTMQYPVSELNFAMSKQGLKRCRIGRIGTEAGLNKGSLLHPCEPQYLINHYGDPLSECPYNGTSRNGMRWNASLYGRCGADTFPPLEIMNGIYYKPRPMNIMNSQPLGAEAQSGLSFYNLYLDSPVADDYKILLPLNFNYTLRPIPIQAEITSVTSSTSACENDVGLGVTMQIQLEQANEQLQEAQDALTERLKDIMGIGPADCQTNEGFTFDVCEGRSRHAVYDSNLDKWIDESPKCKSYRDNKNGSTLKTPRTYPRWNRIPSYADPTSTDEEYLGPNPDSHIVIDWMRASDCLSEFISSPRHYHFVEQIGERIDEDVGQIMCVMECNTCKSIVKAGSVLNYRMSTGECDENGVAINFPQEVIDAELNYEQGFPTKDLKGNPVPTAWGIVAAGDHNGKKMLENPDLRIKIL